MKALPMIVGAMALAIAGGALMGNAIEAKPIRSTSDTLATLPNHKFEMPSAEETQKLIAPANHYPLETPDGVIAVAELAFHGRLRSRLRDQPVYGAEEASQAFALSAEYSIDEYRPERREAYAGSFHPRDSIAPANHAPQTVQHATQNTENFVPIEDGIFETRDTAALAANPSPAVEVTSGANRIAAAGPAATNQAPPERY